MARTIDDMSDRSAVRGAHLLGFALGGVLAGHALTYGVLEPSEHGRRSILEATGHAYLGTANRMALSVAVAAVAAAVLTRAYRGAGSERGIAWLAVRLIPVQVSAFLTLEVGERLLVGAPLHDLARILPLGLAVQVSFAVLAAAALRVLVRTVGRAAEVLGEAAAPAARASVLVVAPTPAWFPRSRIAADRPPARAPPLAAR